MIYQPRCIISFPSSILTCLRSNSMHHSSSTSVTSLPVYLCFIFFNLMVIQTVLNSGGSLSLAVNFGGANFGTSMHESLLYYNYSIYHSPAFRTLAGLYTVKGAYAFVMVRNNAVSGSYPRKYLLLGLFCIVFFEREYIRYHFWMDRFIWRLCGFE